MSTNALQAISPIDGRYASKTQSLVPFFSEEALIKYRVQVEIEYFIALVNLPLPQLKDFDKALFASLRKIYTNFFFRRRPENKRHRKSDQPRCKSRGIFHQRTI